MDLRERIRWFDDKNAASGVVLHHRKGVNRNHWQMIILEGQGVHAQEEYKLGVREFELLNHVVSHPVSHADYAEILGTSEQTLKNHLNHLYEKFDVVGEEALIAKLVELGILEYPPSGDGTTPLMERGIEVAR